MTGRFDHCFESPAQSVHRIVAQPGTQAPSAPSGEAANHSFSIARVMAATYGVDSMSPDARFVMSVLNRGRTPEGAVPSSSTWSHLLAHPVPEVRLQAQTRMGLLAEAGLMVQRTDDTDGTDDTVTTSPPPLNPSRLHRPRRAPGRVGA